MEQRKVSDIDIPKGGPYTGCGPQNDSSSFFALIVYVQLEFEELKRRFPAYVNPDYNGVRFDPIERCKDVSKESREVVFEYIHMECEALTDEVFTVMDCSGLRPALYEELLGFAEKYPDEQRKYPIVALGSVTLVDGNRRVAYLWQKLNTRIQDCCLSPHSIATLDSRDLCLEWREYGWDRCFRFLAVRK